MSLPDQTPDVAQENIQSGTPIDFSGIRDLEMPVRLSGNLKVPAKVNLFVSLEGSQRGIHMSRMYRAFHGFCERETLSFEGLKRLVLQIIREQGGKSRNGRIKVSARWPVKRKALKSAGEGWRHYPFFYEVTCRGTSFDFVFGGGILYSSTCPCSAALSRQMISRQFDGKFSKAETIGTEEVSDWLKTEEALFAVPHGQKSRLLFRVRLKSGRADQFSFLKFVDGMETALSTPVQTFVKREDEAEFARLNGRNLMFCEDAVRRSARYLDKQTAFQNYFIQARHYESLHPFQVESSLAKGSFSGGDGPKKKGK